MQRASAKRRSGRNGVTDETMLKLRADALIRAALEEDVTGEDVSTASVLPAYARGTADLIAKQAGVIAGLPVFARAFQLLDGGTEVKCFVSDGDRVENGQLLATVTGDMRVILTAERTALNFLQRMSGIATATAKMCALLAGSGLRLVDTRKTTPNMRIFEKYAVRTGGGGNHRYNLSDAVLLKDNHIGAAGSVTKAKEMAKAYAPFVRKIEIETETLEHVQEALDAGADIIMLENMVNDTMKKAVALINGRAETECSGYVTKERLKEIAEIGVDYVSSGALTHSAPVLDISLKNLKPVE